MARVGDGFLRAIDQGLADPNSADGITPGTFNLWSASDSRHASRYGTSTPLGDDTTVTLVDASNNPEGFYSLSLLAGDFTASAAGSTSGALATINYTAGVASITGNPVGSVQSKLGAVSFSLADLGVNNPASVSAATGLRLTISTLDPNVVGQASRWPGSRRRRAEACGRRPRARQAGPPGVG